MAAHPRHREPFDFLSGRKELRRTDSRAASPLDSVKLVPGRVALAVDAFGFTANNISCAIFVDAMKYWNFFPAAAGWGQVPVSGFATVARSSHSEIAAGERVYGLPMSSYFVVDAGKVTTGSFSDRAAHRQDMDAFDNLYLRNGADPGYDPALVAERVLVSSVSSKTSIALAFQLFQHGRERCEAVGVQPRWRCMFVTATA